MTDPQSAADLARRIVATAGDAIIAADRDGRVILWNRGQRRCSATQRTRPSVSRSISSSPRGFGPGTGMAIGRPWRPA